MADKFIQQATAGHKGLFSGKAKAAGETTRGYAAKEQHAPGNLGKEARLALTLMKMPRGHGGKPK